MWDSNTLFTASGASKALVLAKQLPKVKQREFLDELKTASTNWEKLLNENNVQFVYDAFVK